MDYNKLLNKHLYSFIKEILEDARKNGLEHDSQLLISYDTRHRDIILSKKMRDMYPEELTIVLDEEYYDLTITDNGFSVRLIFDDVGSETLFIPYAAITSFSDPEKDFSVELEPDMSLYVTADPENVISFKDIVK